MLKTTSRFSIMKYLEQLYNKNNEEMLTEVLNSTSMDKCIQKLHVSDDAMYFFVGILSRIAFLPSSAEKTRAISIMCNRNLSKELVSFVMLLPSQISTEANSSGKTLWKNIDTFLVNTIFYCFCIFDVAPASAIDKVSKLMCAIQLTISNLESESLKIADCVKEQLTQLEKRLEMCIKEFNEKPNNCLEDKPSNDFRDISIYPTSEEILLTTSSFLRKNKVVGRYKDVSEYLDIHFRLLREDFVKPLRESIKEYILQQNSASIEKHTSTIVVHKNVKFLEAVYANAEKGIKIEFDQRSCVKAVDIIYGSLVCFTKDLFQTVIFGRILSADCTLLKQRQQIVCLDTNAQVSYTDEYIMFESNVYFEPYYVVLKSLQQLEDTNFPMKQFIVDVCPTIKPPRYLQEDTKYNVDGYTVPILHEWPDENHFKLNQMQYEGFRRALTKELVIIQGPPGTGKTHLGLNIVKTILNNKQYWSKQAKKKAQQQQAASGPMLVLCYTNHALDQFLEGILNFTTSIVRVGGRSKSEILKSYNLKEISLKFVSRNESLKSLKIKLTDTASKIKKLNATLDLIKQCDGVIDFHEFEEIEPKFRSSWFDKNSSSEIKLWLMGNINKRSYIEQMEFNYFEKHKLEPDFDTRNKGLLSQMMSSSQRTDAENIRIEIHSGFDRMNTQNVELNLTVDLRVMRRYLKNCMEQLRILNQHLINPNPDVLVEDRELMAHWHKLEMFAMSLEEDLKYVKMRLLEGEKMSVFAELLDVNLSNPLNMPATDRWNLYFHWLDLYKKWAENRINNLADTYLKTFVRYEEEKALRDINVMRECDVIGMTTTGGARLQSSLQKLKCPIVVVEEAAEILESHVVASLTEDCQHLILIGDHQQLRPKPADYSIEKDMQLGISLFERFIMNKFEYSTLNIQHRMRPEISSLICPAIYSDLIDHPSVVSYPPVKGISSSVYFIDHSEKELACASTSKKNLHEARFLARLAQYLLHNRYTPTDITILVSYKGQYYAVMQELEQLKLKDVSCAVLDNYQGEESKIILLSLVRNNNHESIGFLKIENRVCVALSRAKEGLYIMGNMELLCRNSKIWPKVKDALVAQNAIGEYLALYCQNHTERTVQVKNPNDFDQVPNGCCGQICGFKLSCGHKCELFCHLNDIDHVAYKCKQPCSRTLCKDIDHVCKKVCFEECGLCEYEVERTLSCGHTHKMPCHTNVTSYECKELITTSFPDCGHVVVLPCYKKLSEVTCSLPCDMGLEKCGHICSLTCHVNKDPQHKEYVCKQRCSKDAPSCSLDSEKHRCRNKCYMECKPCSEMVEKQMASCKHAFKVPCSQDVEDAIEYCSYPCNKILKCGHTCQSKCGLSCTSTCKKMVEKVSSVCGHNVACECGDDNFEENTQCRETVTLTNPAACGHKFIVQCYVNQLPPDDPVVLAFCPEKCTSILACGHPCTGTCFDCFQGRFHVPCTALCKKRLVCGHKCQLPCGKPCEPCFQKCSLSCVHKKCTAICGQKCFQCNQKCPRSCVHATCSGRCGYQFCTVDECSRYCEKTLACGHRCTGYCGDVCPKCKICNAELVKKGERFITLQECGHVFEIKEIKEFLKKRNPVGIKMCPLCKAPLCSTQRLKYHFWKGINERQYILKEIYTNFDSNEDQRWLTHVKGLTAEAGIQINLNAISATESACFKFKKEILIILSKHLQSIKKQVPNAWYMCHHEVVQFLKTTERFFNCITFSVQETMDVSNEFKRCRNKLEVIVILVALDSKSTSIDVKSLYERNKIHLDDEEQATIKTVISTLFSVRTFSKKNDNVVKKVLNSLNTNCILKNIILKNELKLPEIVNYSSESWFRCPKGHISPSGQGYLSCKTCNKKTTDTRLPNLYRNNAFKNGYKNKQLSGRRQF